MLLHFTGKTLLVIFCDMNFNFLVAEEKRGELIAVQSKFKGFGDMLPKTDFASSISPAANAIICPAMVRKPENVRCRVSGKFQHD